MKNEKNSLLSDSRSGSCRAAKGLRLLGAGFFVTMKTRNQKARKSAGEQKIRVALKSPDGRFTGSVSIDASIWRAVERISKESGKTIAELFKEAVRDCRALLAQKEVAA
ncbi:MAG TPA: hypothetical protein PLS03_06795 [Terrimicrobiaceae bacterium]|nr:hypothetical protein [Terrimicrobiaceae bacterium]